MGKLPWADRTPYPLHWNCVSTFQKHFHVSRFFPNSETDLQWVTHQVWNRAYFNNMGTKFYLHHPLGKCWLRCQSAQNKFSLWSKPPAAWAIQTPSLTCHEVVHFPTTFIGFRSPLDFGMKGIKISKRKSDSLLISTQHPVTLWGPSLGFVLLTSNTLDLKAHKANHNSFGISV